MNNRGNVLKGPGRWIGVLSYPEANAPTGTGE